MLFDNLLRLRDRVLSFKVGRVAEEMTKNNFWKNGLYGKK